MRSSLLLLACLAACGNDVSLGGPGTLVRIDSEPPGANCSDGGVRINTGLDQDGDLYLDDEEVTSVQYVCNGVHPVQCAGGTVLEGTIAISSDAELSELDKVDCVDGDLLITGITASELPDLPLSTVTGDIVLAGNSNLTTLEGLANLREVGGTYLIQGNESLQDLMGIAYVRRVNGISIIGNDALTSLHGMEPFSELDAVLTVANNASLTSVSGLENVVTAKAIFIKSNLSLTNLDALYQLRSVVGLEVSGNSVLGHFAPASLEQVTSRLQILSNPQLSVVSMPSLKTVGDWLRVDGNGALTSFDAPGLLTVSSLIATNNTSLVSLHAPHMVFATVGIELGKDPKLSMIDLSALAAIGGTMNLYSLPQLANLTGFSKLGSIGGALILDHADLLHDFSGLDNVTLISGDMTVQNNAALASFTGLAKLHEIGGGLTIKNNPMLPASASNAFASRVTVHGTVTIN